MACFLSILPDNLTRFVVLRCQFLGVVVNFSRARGFLNVQMPWADWNFRVEGWTAISSVEFTLVG